MARNQYGSGQRGNIGHITSENVKPFLHGTVLLVKQITEYVTACMCETAVSHMQAVTYSVILLLPHSCDN